MLVGKFSTTTELKRAPKKVIITRIATARETMQHHANPDRNTYLCAEPEPEAVAEARAAIREYARRVDAVEELFARRVVCCHDAVGVAAAVCVCFGLWHDRC